MNEIGIVMASQITSLTIVYSSDYSGADQRKYQSSASLAFVRGIQRWPMNSPHKWPVTRKMFPFDDVIILWLTKYPMIWWCHDIKCIPHYGPLSTGHSCSSMCDVMKFNSAYRKPHLYTNLFPFLSFRTIISFDKFANTRTSTSVLELFH